MDGGYGPDADFRTS